MSIKVKSIPTAFSFLGVHPTKNKPIAKLLANRDILFFDEATSSLDGFTESNVINAVRKLKNKTLFIISHNFSTIKNCDKIIFLEDGKVEDVGNYTELVEKNKKFASLAEVS